MTDPLLDLMTRHAVRRFDRGDPLRAAERTEVANHVLGVGYDGVTYYELLRASRSDHPELQRRLTQLCAMTYRRGNGTPRGGDRPTTDVSPRSGGLSGGPSMTAAVAPQSSRGVEYGRPVEGLRGRIASPADIARGRAIAACFADYVDY